MNKRKHMIWFVMLGLYFSCSSPGSTPQRSGGYTVDYQEDLSAHRIALNLETPDEPAKRPEAPAPNRPENTVTVNNDITEELEELTSSVAEKNKNVKTISGLTIQVYSGNSREMAYQIRRRIWDVLPDAQPEVKYQQPIYKVQVGQYTERLEAQKIFALLKKEFPGALIIPSPIQINK